MAHRTSQYLDNVEHDSVNSAKRVTIISGGGSGYGEIMGAPVFLFQDQAIAGGNNLDLIIYTKTVGKAFYLVGIIGSGNANGVFKFIVDGAEKIRFKNSAAEPTKPILLGKVMPISGSVIKINCENTHGSTKDFQATLLGLEV